MVAGYKRLMGWGGYLTRASESQSVILIEKDKILHNQHKQNPINETLLYLLNNFYHKNKTLKTYSSSDPKPLNIIRERP